MRHRNSSRFSSTTAVLAVFGRAVGMACSERRAASPPSSPFRADPWARGHAARVTTVLGGTGTLVGRDELAFCRRPIPQEAFPRCSRRGCSRGDDRLSGSN